jgi:hypothetical protein
MQCGNCQLTKTGVAVEKLTPAKFAKIKSRQDARETTFSVFLDIFYPPNLAIWDEKGVFQQPQAITRFDLGNRGRPVNERNGDFSPTIGSYAIKLRRAPPELIGITVPDCLALCFDSRPSFPAVDQR